MYRKTLEGSQEVWMQEGSQHYGQRDRILGVSEEEMPASRGALPPRMTVIYTHSLGSLVEGN